MQEYLYFCKAINLCDMKATTILMLAAVLTGWAWSEAVARTKPTVKPRILISTDIGGTDPDDNQSMAHFLMYSDEFDTEGIVSSPSYGTGSKEEVLRMIDIYEQDLPRLQLHAPGLASPDSLRAVTKQGRRGAAPLCGYQTATEGSDWIVRCARRRDVRPLYILVWGGLDDVAQALHDAPDIATKIRIYWIGGPNKKWSVNSYVYIVENFPDLWIIENNVSYRAFISDGKNPDHYNCGFYNYTVNGAGNLGRDFGRYLEGRPKMGDTPSLLYMMDGDPANPEKESWGGRFERCTHSPRTVFHRAATPQDTVQNYAIIEFHVSGPQLADSMIGRPCITLDIAKQRWSGYYMGDGDYMVRYSTYTLGTLPYTITSEIKGFPKQQGAVTIKNEWPGRKSNTDYAVGAQWYTDIAAPAMFHSYIQGGKTILKWRDEVMDDWVKRWNWIK